MKMMNDMELDQIAGGFTMEEFLNITSGWDASQFLSSQGYGPGTEQYERFMKLWITVNGNQ